MKVVNLAFENAINRHDAATIDGSDETLKGEAAAQNFLGVTDFEKVLEELDEAPGRQADEGWLESLFSPAIDKTDDDLEIQINDYQVWPYNGYGNKTISNGTSQNVGITYFFNRKDGFKFHLIEYDRGSDNDDLGSLKLETDTLIGEEEYVDAYAYNVKEGSLYGLTFNIDKFYSPTDVQKVKNEAEAKSSQAIFNATTAAIYALQHKENEEDFPARKKAEEERIEQHTRDEILRTEGPDALAKYDNFKIWKGKYAEHCKAYDAETGKRDLQEKIGRSIIPGTWHVGKLNARGEKDKNNFTEYKFERENWWEEKGAISAREFKGIWNAKPLVKFDRYKMRAIVPLLDPTWVASDRKDYCSGIFIAHNHPERQSSADYNLKHSAYTDKTNPAQNYAPLFFLGEDKPTAYLLNDVGEPVMWMEKIRDAATPPKGLCHASGDPQGWQNDHDLEKIMPGTWAATQTCGDGMATANSSQKTPLNWTFTSDGLFMAHQGGGENLQLEVQPWKDLDQNCQVEVLRTDSSNLGRTLCLDRDVNKGKAWSFETDGWPFSALYRDKKCYRLHQVSTDVKPEQMTLAERTNLDKYRARNGLKRPSSERKSAAAIEYKQRQYENSLTRFQLEDGCKAIGNKYTTAPRRINKGRDQVHIRNDSEHVWSVYWIDNQGNDRIEHPSNRPIDPVAVVQPGEMKIIKSMDGFIYSIYGDAVKYGISQCVGTVTAEVNSHYDKKTKDRWGREDTDRVSGKLFTSGYETERVARLEKEKRRAEEVARKKQAEIDRKRDEKRFIELQKEDAERQRKKALADAAAEAERLKRIKDAKGCLDQRIVSEEGNFETLARIINNRSEAIFAHWVNYDGVIDRAHPTVTIPAGEARLLVDYAGARYKVEDGDQTCLAVVNTDGTSHSFSKSGSASSSTEAKTALTYALPFAPRPKLTRLFPEQIENGCEFFGQIGSRPTTGYPRNFTIFNEGKADMNVRWVSYYGKGQTGPRERQPGIIKKIPAGNRWTFDGFHKGDVLEVVENDGRCVAVVKASGTENGSPIYQYHFVGLGALEERKRLADETAAKRKAEEDEADRLAKIEADRKKAVLDEQNRLAELAAVAERQARAIEAARRKAETERLQREAEAAEAARIAAAENAHRLAQEAEAARYAAEIEALRRAEEEEARRLADLAEAQRIAEEAEARRWAEAEKARRLAEEEAARLAAEEATRLQAIETERAGIMRSKVDAITQTTYCGQDGALLRDDVMGTWEVGAYDGYGEKQYFAKGQSYWDFNNGQQMIGETRNGPFNSFWNTSSCSIAISGRVTGFDFEFTANVIENQDRSKEFFVLDNRGELFMWGFQAARVRTAEEVSVIDEIQRLDNQRGFSSCGNPNRRFEPNLIGRWDAGFYDANGYPENSGLMWTFSQVSRPASFRIDGQFVGNSFSAQGNPQGCGYHIFLANQGPHILSFYKNTNGEDAFYVQRQGKLQESLVMWGLRNRDDELRAAQEEADRMAREEEARRLEQERFEAQRRADEEIARQQAAEVERQRLAQEAEARRMAEEEERRRLDQEARDQNLRLDELARRKAEQNGCLVNNLPASSLSQNPVKFNISNVGAGDLMVFWVNASGVPEPVTDANGLQIIVRAGQNTAVPAFRGDVFLVQNQAGQCVGVPQARESRNSFSYDAAEALPGGLMVQPGLRAGVQPDQVTPVQPVDLNNSDYSLVPEADARYCAEAFPNSPQDDVRYDNCMKQRMQTTSDQQGGQNFSDNNRQDQTSDEDLITQRIAIEFPTLSQDEIVTCNGFVYGSNPFFDCLRQKVSVEDKSSGGWEPGQHEDEGQGQNEPGWDRAEVFYKPAYDYCNGELNYALGTTDYNQCYYDFRE